MFSLKNLIRKSSKIEDLDGNVKQILYKYIKEKGYFPRDYLTDFEVNRIDFDFYGASTKNNSDICAMIISFLVINRAFIENILLNISEKTKGFEKFQFLKISCKYIGSILYYLIQHAFSINPPLIKKSVSLYNFYRNYHIFDYNFGFKNDMRNGNISKNDTLSPKLIDFNSINNFFTINKVWCETAKSFILKWSQNLAKIVKEAFETG